MIKQWNYDAGPASVGQTIYQCWLDSLQKSIWADELGKAGPLTPIPEEQTLMELLKNDTTVLGFVDNKLTPVIETLTDRVSDALNSAARELEKADKEGRLQWSEFKDPAVYHLLKNNMLSFARTHLPVGGAGNTINAIKKSHGPSWRMVVQLTAATEAFGVYPGGQSGNPGSRFYDNGVDTWAQGKYYQLWMMKPDEVKDKRVKWIMNFNKG